jgi:hypothetical protein
MNCDKLFYTEVSQSIADAKPLNISLYQKNSGGHHHEDRGRRKTIPPL